RPLRPWHGTPEQRTAEARRTLAGPRAGASRRAVARPPRPMDDAGASRPRARSLSRLSRTHAEQAGAQGGTRRAGVRRPYRFAGPRLPQLLLYHRPQVLSGARHGRARNGDRLGRRASGALCRGAGYRRRSALVFDLRDGVQLRYPLPRAAENLRHPLRGRHGRGIGIACKFGSPDRDRGGGIPRSRVASARAGLSRAVEPAAARGQRAAPDPRRFADRRRPGVARDAGQPQLLHVATLLRILQHARLVLRFLRASATPEAFVLGRLIPQPQRLASKEYWRWTNLCG